MNGTGEATFTDSAPTSTAMRPCGVGTLPLAQAKRPRRWPSAQFASLAEAREVVHNSFELTTYEPRPSARWDEFYTRFTHLLPA